MDWRVYDDSTIGRLPRVVQPIALVARNLRQLVPQRPPYRSDSITTFNSPAFLDEPVFAKAYARAVKAAGWDYGIHYRIQQVLWCAAQARKVPGSFVEVGTGRGFMMSAMLDAYPGWESDGRTLHLFDTFLSAYVDKQGGQDSEAEPSPHYAKSADDVRANFAEWPRVKLHVGDVFETLPRATFDAVAFLHIDLNFAPPEVFALETLWAAIPRGGVVLLDDYAHQCHVPQREAMDALGRKLGFAILSTPTGQGIIIK